MENWTSTVFVTEGNGRDGMMSGMAGHLELKLRVTAKRVEREILFARSGLPATVPDWAQTVAERDEMYKPKKP